MKEGTKLAIVIVLTLTTFTVIASIFLRGIA